MTYDLMKTALDVSALRQETISSNISNVNTPGYKATRVVFEEYLKNPSSMTSLRRTHVNHIDVNSDVSFLQKEENKSVQDNGNNVDVDYEMTALSANDIYYDSVVSQLNSKYSMIRTVMK